MSVPGPSPYSAITDQMRERAVAHLQAMYANNSIDEAELDRRLDLALAATDRIQLNRSLAGLARIAPTLLTPRAPGQATPAENMGSGLVHLSGLATSFVGPAIVKTVAKPGSHLWWEAGRAMSLQLTFLLVGLVASVAAWLLGLDFLFFLAWAGWIGSTIWASVRAFNGKKSTGVMEQALIAKPQLPPPAITR